MGTLKVLVGAYSTLEDPPFSHKAGAWCHEIWSRTVCLPKKEHGIPMDRRSGRVMTGLDS